MEMTIDEHKEHLLDIMDSMPDDACGDWRDSLAYAIETMRKYQKIEQIIDNWTKLEEIEWQIREVMEEQLSKQADDKIVHVGDEICSITGDKAVVQGIDTWHRYQCFTDSGKQLIIDTETFNDYWVKTGKNYPQIAEVLKQMKEDEK